ncbi:hypothetical protein OS190_14020 [Sulfitobacter sp. F26204]|uniref:hypothetical protein n=1 Tax=Sulfitobacter sp. F26204 TaxID=2996014 RepID=UPI00225E1C64|nr:hypothetical protein [Sulfitobacter sp. F26204]MCX7560691.1 hypothetical protein [Sulfitobacter sp. F26204]
MMGSTDIYGRPRTRQMGLFQIFAVGCGAFVVGISLTFGYLQWKMQQGQLAQLAQTIEELQLANQNNQNEIVTRSANIELTTVAPLVADQSSAALRPLTPTDSKTLDTLVQQAAKPEPIPQKMVADKARFQTLAMAIQGVNQLTNIAKTGNYVLSEIPDALTGKTLVVFPDHAKDQERVVRLLEVAAADGMIPYDETARRPDGSFDGHAILTELMQSAL